MRPIVVCLVVGEGVGTDLVFQAIMQIAAHRIQESVVLRAIRVHLHVRLVHAEQPIVEIRPQNLRRQERPQVGKSVAQNGLA